MQIQARMFEKAQLRGVDYDQDTRGVFARDPEMDAFIISGPAVAAGLKIQSGFEDLNNKNDCLKIIQDYTRGGGDNGVGVRFMRECCGLKPLSEPSLLEAPEEAAAAVEGVAPAPVQLHLPPPAGITADQEADDEHSSKLANVSLQVTTYLLEKHLDGLTPSYLAACKINGMGAVAAKKPQLWKAFIASCFWRKSAQSQGKASEMLYPRVQTNKPFGVLFAPGSPLGHTDQQLLEFEAVPKEQLITVLNEQYDLEPLNAWKVNLPTLKANSTVLVSTLVTAAKK